MSKHITIGYFGYKPEGTRFTKANRFDAMGRHPSSPFEALDRAMEGVEGLARTSHHQDLERTVCETHGIDTWRAALDSAGTVMNPYEFVVGVRLEAK